jgi:hypothetical protein
MAEILPDRRTRRVAAFLDKVQAIRGRLIFIMDATASREPAWDTAVQLQSQMFEEAAKIGALEIQLVYYRGPYECSHSRWTPDARELASVMSRVKCMAGHTQIAKALVHVHKEHRAQKVNAVVFVGDAMEENPRALYDATAGLGGVPIFLFQEGHDPDASETFKELARLTKGAYEQFSPGAAHKLAELLRAVAAFTAGGMTALADLRTDGARKLLGQLK